MVRLPTTRMSTLPIHGPAPVTRYRGSESVACVVVPCSPRPPPLAPPHSAVGRPTLFAGFVATMARSDFSRPFVIGYGSSPSRCGPVGLAAAGRAVDLPVPVQGACEHAGVSDHAGPDRRSRWRARPCCLPPRERRRHPGCDFRGSLAGLLVPLSTLRPWPHGQMRMTRGQCGSLLLHCNGLSPSTSCRSSRRTAAQYLARGLPCERLTSALAGRRASLGVGAVG